MRDLNTVLQTVISSYIPNANAYTYKPFGNGLINDTYLIETADNNQKFILQKINTAIFKYPEVIARNTAIIQKAISCRHSKPVSLEFLTCSSGELFHTDQDQQLWRMSIWVPQSITLTNISSPEQAYQTANAFGFFSTHLQGNSSLHIETSIPDFHNLTLRYQSFKTAIENSSSSRYLQAKKWIDFLQSKETILERYESIIKDEILPVRIQHGDTKISNILFDELSLQPLCVIDWDTVMPGYFISDLGDMIRTIVPSCDENEADLNKILFRTEYYHALLKGYKDAVSLTPAELEAVPFAGRFMTYMQALRFITDYLNNDVYYQISYEEHNLVRAKNQCHFLQLIEENT